MWFVFCMFPRINHFLSMHAERLSKTLYIINQIDSFWHVASMLHLWSLMWLDGWTSAAVFAIDIITSFTVVISCPIPIIRKGWEIDMSPWAVPALGKDRASVAAFPGKISRLHYGLDRTFFKKKTILFWILSEKAVKQT